MSYEELVETEGRPWLRAAGPHPDRRDRGVRRGLRVLALLQRGQRPRGAPSWSGGADPAAELQRYNFPRQTRGRFLCLADFFRDRQLAADKGPDVVAFHLVTMGRRFRR